MEDSTLYIVYKGRTVNAVLLGFCASRRLRHSQTPSTHRLRSKTSHSHSRSGTGETFLQSHRLLQLGQQEGAGRGCSWCPLFWLSWPAQASYLSATTIFIFPPHSRLLNSTERAFGSHLKDIIMSLRLISEFVRRPVRRRRAEKAIRPS